MPRLSVNGPVTAEPLGDGRIPLTGSVEEVRDDLARGVIEAEDLAMAKAPRRRAQFCPAVQR